MAESRPNDPTKRLGDEVVSSGGSIFAFGHNGFGQIERDESSRLNKPKLLTLNVKREVRSIFATWRFTMVETASGVILLGSLEPSGKNQYTNINFASTMKKILPINDKIRIAGLSSDGKLTLVDDGKLENPNTMVERAANITDIWLTHEGLLLKETSYRLLDSSPELTGVSFPLDSGVVVQQVSCGHSHSAILTKERVVYTYGVGTKGELGHGDLESRESPVLLEALGGLNVMQLASGGWHNLALTESGDLYSWGWNESGQLGLGIEIQVISTPTMLPMQLQDEHIEFKRVSCGSRHSCSLTRRGDLYTWGWGAYGQLGHRDFANQSSPKLLSLSEESERRTVVDMVAGHWNTFISTMEI